ncbi:MAG: PAAR domain-containing protein [Polyangiaceae bacterium]|nr:PAAR domain-containing protein [Polyangiaceae bacterium]
MSEQLPAARVDDPIHHDPGIAGFFAGAFAGAIAAVGVALLASTGVGLVALVAIGAAGAAGGGIIGEIHQRTFGSDIHTGNLTHGSANVLVNGRPLVRMADKVEPCWVPILYAHGETAMVEGSISVLINCLPAARVGDETLCGAHVSEGSHNVVIGGPKGRINGTESSVLSFVLERLSIVTFATSSAIWPGAGALSLFGLYAYQSDYERYKAINEGGAEGIKNMTGLDVDPSYVGFGIEVVIGIVSGKIANRIPGLNWSALKHITRAQAYAKYAANPKAKFTYERWLKHYNNLWKVRPTMDKAKILEERLSKVLELFQNKASFIKIYLDNLRQDNVEAASCSCDSSWYTPASD